MANRVVVSELAVTMQLGNNGITLQVQDGDGGHRGYLSISRGHLRWYKGKQPKPTYEITLDKFIWDAENGE